MWFNVTNDTWASSFIDPVALDFGLKPNSILKQFRPTMTSCPRASTNRRIVTMYEYQYDFNIKEPENYRLVVGLDSRFHRDQSLASF